MIGVYDVIKRPLVTEKGVTKKDAERTLCFEVAAAANKTQIRQAVQTIFKVKVAEVRTSMTAGKLRRRGRFAGYRARLEESLRQAEGRRKNAGVRGDLSMPIKSYRPTTPTRRFTNRGLARRDHQADARKEPGARQEGDGRAVEHGPDFVAIPGRRAQAGVSRDRFQARQGRDRGEGRGDRVRSEPQRANRAAALRRRREALHSGAGRVSKSGAT